MEQRYYNLSYYGLYLYDFYISCENFGLPYYVGEKNPSDTFARALFILDTHSIIDEHLHHDYFFPMWRGINGVVYLVTSPASNSQKNDKTQSDIIPNALDIISTLELGGNITSNIYNRDAMNAEFIKALGSDKLRFFQNLYKAKYIGMNADGEKVLASYFGRFIFNKRVKSSTESLLYKDVSTEYSRYLPVLKRHTVQEGYNFDRIAKILTPLKSATTILTDNVISLWPIIKMGNMHYMGEDDALKNVQIDSMQTLVMASLLYDLLPKSPLLSLKSFYSAYWQCYKFEKTRRLSDFSQMGMPTIPMPMCIALLGILGSSRNISSAQINLPLLGIIQSGEVVLFTQKHQVSNFIQDSNLDIKVIATQKQVDAQKNNYQLCVFSQSFLTQQYSIEVDFNEKKQVIAKFIQDTHARLIQFLMQRNDVGRSVFMIPYLHPVINDDGNFYISGQVGTGEDFELMKWLYANYLQVNIVDIHANLFYHDLEPGFWRLIIVGDLRKPNANSKYEHQEITRDIKPISSVELIADYHQLYDFSYKVHAGLTDKSIEKTLTLFANPHDAAKQADTGENTTKDGIMTDAEITLVNTDPITPVNLTKITTETQTNATPVRTTAQTNSKTQNSQTTSPTVPDNKSTENTKENTPSIEIDTKDVQNTNDSDSDSEKPQSATDGVGDNINPENNANNAQNDDNNVGDDSQSESFDKNEVNTDENEFDEYTDDKKHHVEEVTPKETLVQRNKEEIAVSDDVESDESNDIDVGYDFDEPDDFLGIEDD